MSRDLGTRVELVEENVRGIVSTLSDMRLEQRNERKEIADAFDSLRKDLSTRSRPFPFKEVGVAVSVTIAFMGGVISVANWWYDARSAVMADNVAALTRSADPGELAVLKYRLAQLEAAAKLTTAVK